VLQFVVDFAVDVDLVRIRDHLHNFLQKCVCLRQLLEPCAGCGKSLNDKSVVQVWSGSAINMHSYIICDGCRKGDGPLTTKCSCDCAKWCMFATDATCQKPFDLRQGWSRTVLYDENLCVDHQTRLFQSTNPHHEKWKTLFKQVNVNHLVPIDTSKTVFKSKDSLTHFCREIEITLPTSLSSKTIWEVTKSWSWLNVVQVNGQRFRGDNNDILFVTPLKNIFEWLPFDKCGEDEFALFNCNASSTDYGQVATATLDRHGRKSIDLAKLTVKQYMHLKLTLPPLHPNITCDVCYQHPIEGPRWNLHSHPTALDLCQDCHNKNKPSGYTLIPYSIISITRH